MSLIVYTAGSACLRTRCLRVHLRIGLHALRELTQALVRPYAQVRWCLRRSASREGTFRSLYFPG